MCQKVDQAVAKAVEVYGYTEEELKGRSRKQCLVRARHVTMWVAIQLGATVAQISRAFDRDHSTVCHAITKVENRPDLLWDGMSILRRLRS